MHLVRSSGGSKNDDVEAKKNLAIIELKMNQAFEALAPSPKK